MLCEKVRCFIIDYWLLFLVFQISKIYQLSTNLYEHLFVIMIVKTTINSSWNTVNVCLWWLWWVEGVIYNCLLPHIQSTYGNLILPLTSFDANAAEICKTDVEKEWIAQKGKWIIIQQSFPLCINSSRVTLFNQTVSTSNTFCHRRLLKT